MFSGRLQKTTSNSWKLANTWESALLIIHVSAHVNPRHRGLLVSSVCPRSLVQPSTQRKPARKPGRLSRQLRQRARGRGCRQRLELVKEAVSGYQARAVSVWLQVSCLQEHGYDLTQALFIGPQCGRGTGGARGTVKPGGVSAQAFRAARAGLGVHMGSPGQMGRSRRIRPASEMKGERQEGDLLAYR